MARVPELITNPTEAPIENTPDLFLLPLDNDVDSKYAAVTPTTYLLHTDKLAVILRKSPSQLLGYWPR